MKKLKKALAMILSLAMVLGMSVTAFAADAGDDGKYGTADDSGTITVKGIEEEGVTVTAYQIVKATYTNNNESFSGYEALYPNVNPAIDLPDFTNDENSSTTVNISEAQLTAIWNYINSDEGGAVENTTYDMVLENGTATATNLPVGSYLVIISGAETKVYNPVVASIYYTNESGWENGLSEADFDIEEEAAWIKVSGTPNVDKHIIEDGETVKGNSVNIGDTIDYVVGINPIPNYGGSYPKLKLTDTLNPGLVFKGVEGTNKNSENISVVVKDVALDDDVDDPMAIGDKTLVEGTDYTTSVNTNKNEIIIDFVVNGNYTLNDYVGTRVEITYSAILTKDAAINQTANINEVELEYSKDSKVEGETGTDDDKVYSYTFDIDGAVNGSITKKVITKTGEEIDMTTDADGDKGLPGAEFTLYTDANCTQRYENRATGFIGSVESTEGGQLQIYGLEAGTYWMKETAAPEGYSLNTHVFKIVITPTYDDEGKMTDWTITIDDKATSSFAVSYQETEVKVTPEINGTDIPNTKLSSLPSTGGIGTTIFTIGGCIIMIAAAALFFASRKKSAN